MTPDDDRRQREALSRVCEVPPKVARALSGTIRKTQVIEEVAAWIEGDRDVLVVQGDTGSGKTFAAGWAFAWIDHRAPITPSGHRRGPMWVDAQALCGVAAWNDRYWSMFDNASLIVLDDAGAEPAADKVAAAIERVANVSTARLMITTNLAPPAFGDRFGARVMSRIAGSGRWYAVSAPDYRRREGRTSLPAEPFRGPRDLSPKEAAAREAEEAERARLEAEDRDLEAERIAAAEAAAAKFRATVNDIVAAKQVGDPSDEDTREKLRRQIRLLGGGA